MDQLGANQADLDLGEIEKGDRTVSRFCGNWRTAPALQNKDLIEVLKNKNEARLRLSN